MKNAIIIENTFKEYLNTLKLNSITTQHIKNDSAKYNELAEKTMEFINIVLLSTRNRNLINGTGYEFDMFADSVTLHIMNKLDTVLSCNQEHMIKLIVKMSNNKVLDLYRKWKRTYPTLNPKSKNNTLIDSTNTDTPSDNPAVFNFLDDVSWELIAADIDIEGEIMRKENEIEQHAIVLKALKNASTCSRFEVLSLLATKVITNSENKCIKTRVLAEAIDTFGLANVSMACFKTAADLFNISYNVFFTNFTNNTVPAYTSIEDLCDKISHASNNCAVKLCKKIGATRNTKKRIKK